MLDNITKIIATNGEEGRPTGTTKPCMLEGCRGMMIRTKWPDGKITYPYTMGLVEMKPGVLAILVDTPYGITETAEDK